MLEKILFGIRSYEAEIDLAKMFNQGSYSSVVDSLSFLISRKQDNCNEKIEIALEQHADRNIIFRLYLLDILLKSYVEIEYRQELILQCFVEFSSMAIDLINNFSVPQSIDGSTRTQIV